MKKAKLIRKKVLWMHSRLEEELGIQFEVERVKPRLYQFTHRGNGICLGYTQLQIGLFAGEDIPFCESNGFFLSLEVSLVKRLLKCDYELEFPHRAIVRVEKSIRSEKRELEQRLREIKKKAIVGGVGNVVGKQQKVGKPDRKRVPKPKAKSSIPKRAVSKSRSGSRVRKPSNERSKRRSGGNPTSNNRRMKRGK